MDQEEREYNEIDLMDYIKVILKRKWLIFAIFLASVIIVGVVNFFLPKVYEINTSLEIGRIMIGTEETSLDNKEQVVEKIKGDIYGIPTRKELAISEKDYPQIKVDNPENTNLVAIRIESDKVDLAKSILEEINKLILEEHQEMIVVKQGFFEKEIKLLENNTEISRQDIERLEIKIASLKKEQNNLGDKVNALQGVLIYENTPGTQFALFNAKERLETKIQEIEDRYLEINSLEAAMNSLKNQINSLEEQIKNIKLTQVLKAPTVSEEPISPKPLLNIVLAGILGIFMGTFFAFFKEWWERSK